MFMKLSTPIFFLCLGSLVFFNSCKKDEQENPILTTDITLPCDYFKSNRTLVNDTNKAVDYIINCVMEVEAGITIEPGVVIQFEENAGIVVKTGFFKAVGTEAKPVQLKGKLEIPGFWKGVYFQNGSLQNELTYTHISSSGGSAFDSNGDRGSVLLFGPGKVKMNHCKIDKSGYYGLNAPYSNCEFEVKNTLFSNCAKAPIHLEPEYMQLLDNSNTFVNNAENHVAVQLNGGVLNGNQSIQALSIPYRFYQLSSFYEWLIIQNGTTSFAGPVVLQFDEIVGISVSTNGGLKIEGTATEKALLTGSNPTPGSWKGIYFEGTQLDNRLNHTIIEYSGSLYDNNRFGISMWNSPQVTVENSTFRNINGCAFFDYNGADNPNPNLTQNNNNTVNVSGGNVCFP